ncbi:hypothetical protein [Streptomyces nodosus]|nr:hypothetical protein [Streptomyces nodosus]MBB4794466.1 hypothetical protein [Streptomyces nodosus]
MGSLGLGQKTKQGCEFPCYTVEVSHRGELTQTEGDLRAGGLAFTLGD